MVYVHDPLTDIAALRSSIYATLIARYGSLSGAQVLQALRDASEDMYGSGIDHALQGAVVDDLDNIADAWDLTWLSLLARELSILKNKHGS